MYESIYEVVNPPTSASGSGGSSRRGYGHELGDDLESEDLEILDSEDEFDEIIEEEEEEDGDENHRKVAIILANITCGLDVSS